MTLLLGMNGYKRSGKNEAADVISHWGQGRELVVEHRAFADLLKLSAARSLGLVAATNINDAVVLMDSLKESGTIEIAIPEQSILKAISGREYLKWFGTEGHRDVFGQDFWVDQVIPIAANLESERDLDILVLTDVRFANEARRIRSLGGKVWNIDRGLAGEDHPSEQPLPKELIDKVIPNRGSLEQFRTAVNSEMTAEFHMRFVKQRELREEMG